MAATVSRGMDATAIQAMPYNGGGNNGVYIVAVFASVLCIVLLAAATTLLLRLRKNMDREFAVNFRHRIYVEELQDNISSLKKVIQHLQLVLKEHKAQKTDSMKTITEQQWQLDLLAKRVHVMDCKEEQRRSYNSRQAMLSTPIVAAFHNMALHPMRNVMPTKVQWDSMTEAVESASPYFRATVNHNQTLRMEEWRVCLLIKAEFKMSEICWLLGMSNSKLTNMRTRLLGKVFGKEGGAKEFDRLLHEL